MNEAAAKAVTKARIQLIRLQPFFGSLVMNLEPVEKTDLEFNSLATDGSKLYYSPDWVLSNPPEVVQAGFAHEVMHCVLQHVTRKGAREAMKWNVAIDFVTNAELKEAGFTLGEGWLFDRKYAGWSADAVYNDLPDNPTSQAFDSHLPPDAETDTEVLQAQWESATIQASFVAEQHKPGSTPANIRRFIDKLSKPQVDWRTVMQQFARSIARDDYSWTRVARRWVMQGLMLPGLYSERLEDATFVIDTSGSITNEVLAAFGGEGVDLHANTTPNVMRVMYCDAEVNHVDEFDAYQTPTFDMHGGGGTDFRPPFAWLAERDIAPTCLIYLTDGYGTFPKEPPPYPVLWVMTTDVRPPWGDSVRIEV